tara:strand:- start:68 stop:1552 length:1485 start_codon:yes stop_codon:yes gene_type:complete
MSDQDPVEEHKPKSFAERFRDDGLLGALKPKAKKKADPNQMHFLEHLEDLRWVIFKCAVAFIVGCLAIAIFIDESVQALQQPLVTAVDDFGEIDVDLQSIGLEQYIGPLQEKDVDLGTLRNADEDTLIAWGIEDPHHRTRILSHFQAGQNRHLLQVIRSYSPIFIAMKICFLGGLGISLPFIFYFIGGFVVPGLTAKEKSVLFPGCVAAFILFLAGAAMTYFVILPFSLAFTIEFTFDVLGLDTYRPEAGNYYSTVIWMTFAVGLAFEFPLIIVLLTWIGMLSVEKLRKNRRMVFVILMISAALITPGGDPVSLSILTIPLYFLYELSILSGSFIERRRKKKEWEEWDEDVDGPRPEKPDTRLGLSKKLITVILLAIGTLAWIAVNKQEQLTDFIDAARNFGSFGGKEENNDKTKEISPRKIKAEQPTKISLETSSANGETINLKIGSTLQLHLQLPTDIDLNRSETNGTLMLEAQLIGIHSTEKTLSESNGSK